ncbi:flotillin family protein [Akkermansiaceae bacterium]|jgi:flotillin|nr:flotillin family protein [Akkermansiaceae bacterium]MDB4569323.1 flotillin family protein [bacterium]MDA7621538.1 flotillin family protein [Akkermansiaceae bacterium]MDB4355750.1 flotillin family protein [Akkermansiaceae bacterium]MDB4377054.1 flotillin family protein [Akkermansiaceae bacterium]
MHTLSIIADNFSLVLVSFLLVVVFGTLVFFFSCYQRCPSDKILVIYGKTGGDGRSPKCIHGGAAFVWPIVQDYQYLDLTPIPIDIKLEGLPSRQKIRVNMPATVTIGISTKAGVMQNAAERMLGLDLNQIRLIGQEIISGQMRVVVASMDIETLNSDRDLLIEKIVAGVEVELTKVGLRLININIQNITWDSN